MPKVRVTGFELLPVRATERTVWLMVRLTTDQGLTGLGEASDAFGFANTTKQNALRIESELRKFFEASREVQTGAFAALVTRTASLCGLAVNRRV